MRSHTYPGVVSSVVMIGFRASFFLFFAAAELPFDAAPVAMGGLGLAPSVSCCEPFMVVVGPVSSGGAAGRDSGRRRSLAPGGGRSHGRGRSSRVGGPGCDRGGTVKSEEEIWRRCFLSSQGSKMYGLA